MAEEFEQKLLDVARVARVVAGGRRFSFRALAIVGDKRGRVGMGVGKGPDVQIATAKAVRVAKKGLIEIPMKGGTISHAVEAKYGSAYVFLKPARSGRGIIAGGPVRVICELAGLEDISAKILSRSTNKINNARATMEALKRLSTSRHRKKVIGSEKAVEGMKEAPSFDAET